MRPYQANLINAIILIALGLWAFLTNMDGSKTQLIAPAFGLVLLLMSPGVKKENKAVAHIVVVLTLLLFIALFRPFMNATGLPKMRVGIMLFSCLVALAVFIKSFIDARKAKT